MKKTFPKKYEEKSNCSSYYAHVQRARKVYVETKLSYIASQLMFV